MKQPSKKLFVTFAVVAFVLAAVIVVVTLLPILRENARVGALQSAEETLALYRENEGEVLSEWTLCKAGSGVVAISGEKAIDVFDDALAAARALLDDPDTEADESVGFSTSAAEGQDALSFLIPALPSAPDEETVGATFSISDECRLSRGFETTPATYEAWIRVPKDSNRSGLIVGNYGGDIFPCFGFEIYDQGAPRLYFNESEPGYFDAIFRKVDVRTGEWLHLAIVNDVEQNVASCYVNGELKETAPAVKSFEMEKPIALAGDFRKHNARAFCGELHSVAVYEKARGAEEIRGDAKAYASEGLTAAWDFTPLVDGCTVLADLSKNGYVATYQPAWLEDRAPVEDYDFSIAVIGDTQMLNVYQPQNFPKLYDWIVEHKKTHKIKYVLGLGDITDVDRDDEWQRAVEGYAKLDEAGIPYAVNIGNHDSSLKFNRAFETGPYSYSFDDSYGYTLANTYRTVVIGGNKYLILTLDFGARDDVLNWASEIIEEHADHNVILTTHAYLYPDGTTIDKNDPYAPTNTNPANNNGDDIWEKLVKKHENIVLVLSGHESWLKAVCTQTKGEAGNTVTQILTDHQELDRDLHLSGRDAAGIVTMLYFSENGTRMTVDCYSTVLEMHFLEENRYTVTLDVVDAE
ncbi:MAG: metallophosphoesterase [Clostridia bacterium]|nr:metallophosphoesterase [Clostridia bacterium]